MEQSAALPYGVLDFYIGSMMTHPNFFIVGAPKCGTTALSEYLREHPNVFMSSPKEPHYFAEYMPRLRFVSSIEDYLALFSDAMPSHSAVGEASVWYLRCPKALTKIKEFAPNGKIIAMLRKPVELVHSMHSQVLITLDEDEPDFQKAWRLQNARSHGENIPKYCRDPALLEYGKIGRLGEQVERLLSIWDPSQVKLILFDDFSESTERVYLEVLDFLAVPKIERPDYPRIKPNKRHKREWLARLTQRPPRRLVAAALLAKKGLGINRLGILDNFRKLNTIWEPRTGLEAAFRAELVNYFRDDIMRLADLLKRDLSAWCES